MQAQNLFSETEGAASRQAARLPFLWRLLPYMILAAGCFSVFAVTTDDPFITYRYALNVIAGHGPVFNLGERVEGFTSPLHLLLCTLLLKVLPSVGMLFKAKLLGMLFAALTIYQTGRLGRLFGLKRWDNSLAQSFVAVNVNLAVAAVNGLETSLYVWLVAVILERFVRECRCGGGILSAWLLGIALLARPETVLFWSALLVVRSVWAIRGRLPLRMVLSWMLPFLWVTILLTLGRLAYYGAPLPNTYYAKHVLVSRGLWEGGWYLLHPLSSSVADMRALWQPHWLWSARLEAMGTIIFWLLALIGCTRRPRRLTAGLSVAVTVAFAAFVLRVGGDWMPGWRFLVPVLPVIAIMQCRGLRRTAVWCRLSNTGQAIPALAAICLWISCAVVTPHLAWSGTGYSTQDETLLAANGPLGRKWVRTAEFIRSNVTSDATVAYSEMGYAGCLNPRITFIDVRGLTDREIARLPDIYKGPFGVDDEQWYLASDPLYHILDRRRPAVIVAFSHQNIPTIVLGRYFLSTIVQDPQDSQEVIVPSLAYLSMQDAGK